MARPLVAIIVTALGIGGCAATRPQPRISPANLDGDAFLAWLADQPMVGAAEAYRAGLLLATGEDPGYDFADLAAKAFDAGIARQEWHLTADTAIDKSTAAYIVLAACRIPGGINLNLFGRALHLGDRRYAWRELVYQGLIRDGNPYGVITGGEFVALLSRADEWRERNRPAVLPKPTASAAAAEETAGKGRS